MSARPVEDGLISRDRNPVLPADLCSQRSSPHTSCVERYVFSSVESPSAESGVVYSQRCSSHTCGKSPGPHAIAVLPPSTKRRAIDPTVVCPVAAVIVPTTPSPAVGMMGPIIALLSRIMHLPSSSVRLELVPWLVVSTMTVCSSMKSSMGTGLTDRDTFRNESLHEMSRSQKKNPSASRPCAWRARRACPRS